MDMPAGDEGAPGATISTPAHMAASECSSHTPLLTPGAHALFHGVGGGEFAAAVAPAAGRSTNYVITIKHHSII